MNDQNPCRVHLCNRKAVPNSNLCDAHYRQIVEKALTRNVDKLIAEENRRFLADPAAMADARAEGEMYRLRLEAEGILPKITESEARALDGNR